jgi:hypothetical protein
MYEGFDHGIWSLQSRGDNENRDFKIWKTTCDTQQRLKSKAICSSQLVIAVVHPIRAFPNREQVIKPSLIQSSDIHIE